MATYTMGEAAIDLLVEFGYMTLPELEHIARHRGVADTGDWWHVTLTNSGLVEPEPTSGMTIWRLSPWTFYLLGIAHTNG